MCNNKCPNCGSNMVEKPPVMIYPSNPPQYDSVMWCGCGYTENRGRVFDKTSDEQLYDLWKRIN
jgi:hypothetical protein